MRAAAAWNPWLLVRFLCTLLVSGSACSRRLVSREDFWSCCTGVEDCLALLQEAKAPGPDPSIPWFRVATEVKCAAFKLRDLSEQPEVLPRLVALLSHPSPRVRDAAVYTFSELRARARDAVPALIEAHEKDPRSGALAALVDIDDPRAAPHLRQYLRTGALQPVIPCLGPTLMSVLVEELENPESPVWARARGLPSRCPDPDERITSRLRELLRRELAQPALRRPSGASYQEPAPKTCQVVLDGCMPHAASLFRLFAPYLGDEPAPELLEALARDDERLTPIVLQILVDYRKPEAFPQLVRQLSSPMQDCRLRALRDLDFFSETPPEATEVLLGLLERDEPSERTHAAFLLARSRDERAIEPLRRMLKSSLAETQAIAARALGLLGQKAKGALPELEELARTASSQDVRRFSAEARYELSGQWKAAVAPHCPRLSPYLNAWDLRRRTGPLHLQYAYQMEPLAPPNPSDPCAAPYSDSFGVSLVPMGDACVVVGGTIRVREKERTIELDNGNRYELRIPYALDFHGSVVLLQGDAHMGSAYGRLDRLRQTPEGAWVLELFAPLPGLPVAYALDERGDLVIATTSRGDDEGISVSLPSERGGKASSRRGGVHPFESSCPEHPETGIVYVVRVTSDGRVFPVE